MAEELRRKASALCWGVIRICDLSEQICGRRRVNVARCIGLSIAITLKNERGGYLSTNGTTWARYTTLLRFWRQAATEQPCLPTENRWRCDAGEANVCAAMALYRRASEKGNDLQTKNVSVQRKGLAWFCFHSIAVCFHYGSEDRYPLEGSSALRWDLQQTCNRNNKQCRDVYIQCRANQIATTTELS